MINDYLTIQEAAKLLKVHINTVRNLLKKNQHLYIKIGSSIRIKHKELIEHLNNLS